MVVGKLKKNPSGRWAIGFSKYDQIELSSGSTCEVQIGEWIKIRIESANGQHYSTVPGVDLYEGMSARLP